MMPRGCSAHGQCGPSLFPAHSPGSPQSIPVKEVPGWFWSVWQEEQLSTAWGGPTSHWFPIMERVVHPKAFVPQEYARVVRKLDPSWSLQKNNQEMVYSSHFSAPAPVHLSGPRDGPVLAGAPWPVSLPFGQAVPDAALEDSPARGSRSFCEEPQALPGYAPRRLPAGHAPVAFPTRSSSPGEGVPTREGIAPSTAPLARWSLTSRHHPSQGEGVSDLQQ